MLFVLALDPIRTVFLYFDLCGHGKLDLEFVHGRAEKCVGSNKIYQRKVYILESEISEENNWQRVMVGQQILCTSVGPMWKQCLFVIGCLFLHSDWMMCFFRSSFKFQCRKPDVWKSV